MLGQNPWWENSSSIEQDPHVRAWTESELHWNPGVEFDKRDYIYSLRGTRQVGKTTSIKLDIRRRLDVHPSRSILYYSFDLESRPGDVADIIEQYLDISADIDKRRYLYLDEVTSVQNWQKAIKYLRDRGRLQNCTVIVVGSNSVDLRKGTELLPGRRGLTNEPLDIVQEPMKFGDYIMAVDRDLGETISKYKNHGISSIHRMAGGEIDDTAYGLSISLSRLNHHLDEYFVVGGMPTAVAAFRKHKTIPNGAYRTYLDSITGDLKSTGSSTAYVRQIMPNIIKSIGTTVSWRSLSRNTDVGSHHTVSEYVATLVDLFVLSVMYRYDISSDGPKYSSMKKIYFRDPLFLHAWNATHHQESIFRSSLAYAEDEIVKSGIAEQVAASHIARLAYNISKNRIMYNEQISVFYWKSKNDNEIDFVVRSGGGIIPIEVKYKRRIRTEDVRGIMDMAKAGAASGGIVLTRDELGYKGGAVMIPLAVFLALV